MQAAQWKSRSSRAVSSNPQDTASIRRADTAIDDRFTVTKKGPRRSYEDCVRLFSQRTLLYLLDQLDPYVYEHNKKVASEELLAALRDTVAAKRAAGESEVIPRGPRPGPKRQRSAEDGVVMMIECGGRGQKVRVVVPRSMA